MNELPEILFTVDLSSDTDLNYSGSVQATTFYPVGVSPNVIKANNGQFTLHGKKATYLRRMIDLGRYPNITYEMVNPPSSCTFELDREFNAPDGFVYTDLNIAAYLSLQNNKPLLYGAIYDSGEGVYGGLGVKRFNENSDLDESFAGDGSFLFTAAGEDAGGVVVLDNNKIVIFFYVFATSFGAAKILTDGSGLDLTFNTDGYVTHALDVKLISNAVASPDGGFYCFGRGPSNDGLIIKLTSNGELDTDFASPDGYIVFELEPGISLTNVLAGIMDGEDLIVSGNYHTGGSNFLGFVAKFDSEGNLDTNFNSPNGFKTVGSTGASEINDIAFDANGKIFACGRLSGHGAIWRFNADGTLDDSFAPVTLSISPYTASSLSTIKVVEGSKILVTGALRAASFWHGYIARYFEDGTADLSFTGDSNYIIFSEDAFQTFYGIESTESTNVYTAIDNFSDTGILGIAKFVCNS